MALDLKIFESVNGLLSGCTWPHPDFVEGEYSLVQQITKCLLTNPGEDQFDPSYGSGLRVEIQGVPGQDVEKAKKIFSAALQKIMSDLKSPDIADPVERLADLRLRNLQYDMLSTSWLADVEVETEAGSTFVISSTV